MSHVISHQDKVIKEITEKKGTVYVNTSGTEYSVNSTDT